MDVKEVLANFAKEVEGKLEKYWQEQVDLNFGFNQKQKDLVKKMLGHATDHNKIGGKRLRAALLYHTFCMGEKVITEAVWNAAMSVEIVHTALLMHDDFMDEDELRRGKPTTQVVFGKENKHYGESMAVSLGDGVLLMGYELLLESGFDKELTSKAVSHYLRGVVNTAWGQAFDVSLPYLGKWTEEDVIALHSAKTAIYTYQNPIFIGAILAQLPQEVFPTLEKYAMHAGVAFQIQDDILGVFGETESTGKSADSDLLQGKSTLLALKTLEMGNAEQVKAFEKVWGKKESTKKDIDLAKKAIKESGALKYNVDFSKLEAKKAVDIVKELDRIGLKKEGLDFLEGIAVYMVNREV